ncbi:hypothetical protein [Polyangium mundeleinium]|uniref:Uncharacterized protein n=1 Tax=Polyangium mundeleinium TaxID=2995306 RepID=A0ABT5ES24_9BACT|nr:hypothetical protein [Polyangium mundeleinium]MDC0744164.1 hypothetical protein [Polyangium mundeleinium]
MKVRIRDTTLFNCRDERIYEQLRRLFDRAYRTQHEIDIDDPEAILDSDFMVQACAPMLRERLRQRWEEFLQRSPADPFAPANKPGMCAVVSGEPLLDKPEIAFVLAPEEVGIWAEQSLDVLLENDKDSILVRLAIRVSKSPKLQSALEQKWIQPRGCGGSGEVKNAVDRVSGSERSFVIIDSDRDEPEDGPSKTARKIKESCDAKKIPIHILARRELENYVPSSIWSMLAEWKGSKSQTIRDTTKRRRARQRAVLIYSWILKQLEHHGNRIKDANKEALDNVAKEIKSKANTTLSRPILHEQFEAWRALDDKQKLKHVDDLKLRFGENAAEKAIQHLHDENFDTSWLDDDARAELLAIAELLEDWL